ncbi:4'-phosphopantetheine phosphatase-like isoform X1 [Sycon ciliatum]|uniref:4'-phosphopantetheine phosphatase-like isoform X1 n=1 Tax=Sycon ciliatum TaxID=27933 RepID=UPI0031F64E8E
MTEVDSTYASSFSLPPREAFRNLENAKRFAIDIGGSLAKLAYYAEEQRPAVRTTKQEQDDSEESTGFKVETINEPAEVLHFVKFETRYIESCLDFITKECPALRNGSSGHKQGQHLKATGGGAFKYRALLEEKLGVLVDKEDEMHCLITGANFVLNHVLNESFIYSKGADGQSNYRYRNNTGNNIFPYLLVNIGSGVSILKVDSPTEYQRIGGTAMGGGTFWGLGSLLTDAQGFDELLDLAEKGSSRSVDMLVSDIYGGEYAALGLPADLTASSFGKCARSNQDKAREDRPKYRQEDITKSLLHFISNDIGQIAYLNARLHNLERIYFAGYFIRGHPLTMHTISFSINYWSKGDIQALFLRHEGYLGAIGAFLAGAGPDDTSWIEHSFSSVTPQRKDTSISYDVLELERQKWKLQMLPLLASRSTYSADLFDLTNDASAREHWIKLMQDGVDKVAQHAASSQLGVPDAQDRAQQFKKNYLERISCLNTSPNRYGSLSIRKLLDIRGHCLLEAGFFDPYSKEKQNEIEAALELFQPQMERLQALPFRERQLALVKNVLAGNMFDWGAQAVVRLLEGDGFGFEESLKQLPDRPWLKDGFDEYCKRLEEKPYKCTMIFVDNCGFDIILGIFPLVCEFLKQGTKVILAANSQPALNDVQHNELLLLAHRVGQRAPEVRTALLENRLVIVETGSTSPCIDLSRVDSKLCEMCREVDFIVLEGMGRAIHTNYTAQFKCDSLKVAIIKNEWLAKRLDGDLFSAVFLYEPAATSSADNGCAAQG